MSHVTGFHSANFSHQFVIPTDGNVTMPDTVQLSSVEITLMAVSLVISFPFIVGGNLLVIIAIIRTPALHTKANILAANLAVTDLLVGMNCLPTMMILYSPDEDVTYPACCLIYFMWCITWMTGGLLLIGK